MGKNHFGL